MDATLTLTGSNLSMPASINGNVVGAVAMNVQTLGNAYYTAAINGPKYVVISVQNTDPTDMADITGLTLAGNSFSIIHRVVSGLDPAYGNNAECATVANVSLDQVNQLAATAQCIVVLTGSLSDPNLAPLTATLSFNTNIGSAQFNQSFDLTNTTYLYVGGDFSSLGTASTTSNYLLAKCANGVCQNFFDDGQSGADNDSIFALTTDDKGNVYVGGGFSNLGTATAGANVLLAKCADGVCQNYLGDSNSGANNRILTLLPDENDALYVGGIFSSLGTATAGGNDLLAKCAGGTCQNYFGPTSTAGANADIISLAADSSGNLYVGGGFSSLGTAAANSDLLAKCTNGVCQNYFGATNTTSGGDNNILSLVTDSGGHVFVGGAFSSLGSATAASNYLLATCQSSVCQNFFGANDTTSGASGGAPALGASNYLTQLLIM